MYAVWIFALIVYYLIRREKKAGEREKARRQSPPLKKRDAFPAKKKEVLPSASFEESAAPLFLKEESVLARPSLRKALSKKKIRQALFLNAILGAPKGISSLEPIFPSEESSLPK